MDKEGTKQGMDNHGQGNEARSQKTASTGGSARREDADGRHLRAVKDVDTILHGLVD